MYNGWISKVVDLDLDPMNPLLISLLDLDPDPYSKLRILILTVHQRLEEIPGKKFNIL